MNNIEENQPLKSKRGRKKLAENGRERAPLKSKSVRVPVALLEGVDKLLAVHKQNSTDGRKHARIPGAHQTRIVDCSEVRQIPLEYLDAVKTMIKAWRVQRGKGTPREKL